MSIHITHIAIEDMLVSKALVSFNHLIVAGSPRRVSPLVKQPDHTAGQVLAFIAEVIWVQLYIIHLYGLVFNYQFLTQLCFQVKSHLWQYTVGLQHFMVMK